MERRYYGIVQKGKFIPDDLKEFKREFYRREGRRVFVTVKNYAKNRSNEQNSYYWGVVIYIISDELGYTSEEAHEAMKFLFLRIRNDGKPDTVRSTTELTTVEMEEYIDNIRRWASIEMNIYIPEPNEYEHSRN